jgi:hypothetical protein
MAAEKRVFFTSGFEAVKTEYFRPALLAHGQKLSEAEHVFNIKEEQTSSKHTIHGRCMPQTNVTKTSYIIEVEVDHDRAILGGRCSCVAGLGAMCKHGAALIYSVNLERDESQTASRCEWSQPSQAKLNLYPKGLPIDDIIKNTRPTLPLKFTPLSEDARAELLDIRLRFGHTNSMLFKHLTDTVRIIHTKGLFKWNGPQPHHFF